jgi:phosphopantothenoylcysteine decarboxylase/phosphopantothenate--cysteine ligase
VAGARIVVGVGGGIAAYKACDLVSKLVQAGHGVDVVMTRTALTFVRPLSFSALTHRRVFTDRAWGRGEVPHDHLRLTREADLLVVAPCTAHLLASFAHGLADGVLPTTWLATACPRLLAPAMNARMWEHPRVQANVAVLRQDGVRFVGPEAGWLSERETGVGRMSEPEDIRTQIEAMLVGA